MFIFAGVWVCMVVTNWRLDLVVVAAGGLFKFGCLCLGFMYTRCYFVERGAACWVLIL